MDSPCPEHKYTLSIVEDMKKDISAMHQDIRTLTDMVSSVLQAQAVGDASRAHIKDEIDSMYNEIKDLKESVVEIRVIREKIVGDLKTERESISKDINAAFTSIRNLEKTVVTISEELEELKKIKAEILASYRTLKFSIGIVAAASSIITWFVEKWIK